MELSKIKKVCKISVGGRSDAEEKINLMLAKGWHILNSCTSVSRIDYRKYEEQLFYVLGNEDPAAEIPLTDYEKQLRQYAGSDY